jgi:uncharacterized protein (UPF0218 family)
MSYVIGTQTIFSIDTNGIDSVGLLINGVALNPELTNLTINEIKNIENMNSTIISAGNWTNLSSLSQTVDTSSSPTFAALSLSNTSNQLRFGVTNTTTINSAVPSASRTYTIPDTAANSNFVMTDLAQTINGNKTFSGSTNLSGLTASTILSLDSSKNIVSNTLTNGQLLIGSTGTNPVIGTLTGTTNQITITNGAGTITLSLPQNINTSSSPSFSTLSLTNATNQLILGTTNTVTISSIAPSASRVYTIPDTAANANFVMTELAQTINGNKTLSGTTNLSGLTANSILTLDASKNIASNVLTNGQLLIGSTGANPVIASLTGTTNQIIVTNGAGTITLSLPQNINTSSSPSFSALTLTSTTNQLILGTTNTVTISSTAPTASRVYTIPDTAANANFVMTELAQTINGSKILSGTTNLSGLTASTILSLDSSKNIVSNILTNGQLLIGSTGVNPVIASLTGTSNQITVTNGAGTITLSLPQSINSTATPTFASLTLTSTTNQIVLGTTDTITISSTAPTASRVYTIPDTAANANFVMTELAQTINGNKTLSGTTNLSGLTASTVLSLDSSKNIVSNTLTNGQLLIGSTGANPVIASLTGTTNQVTVTNGAGTITLSLPQSINTTNVPTFSGLILNSTSGNLLFNVMTTTQFDAQLRIQGSVVFNTDFESLYFYDGQVDRVVATRDWSNSNLVTLGTTQTITGSKTLSGTTNLSGLTASTILSLDSSKNIVSNVLTNGQLLIGSTGSDPVATSLTGTSNQITITNGAGTITLSLPQNINSGATPTFSTLSLTNTTNQLILGTTNTVTISSTAPTASRVYTIPDTAANANFVMTELAQTINGNKTLSGTINLSGLTASTVLSLDSSKNIVSNTLTNGQLLIGSTGTNPAIASLTGTTNQITVTNGAGTITLSLPQSINSTATPTFASLTLTSTTNQLILGTTNTVTINSTAPTASRVYTIPDTAANANFELTELAQTINGNKSLSGTTNLSGLTASTVLSLDSSKNIVSNTLTNGQLLIGSTGANPVVASLTGTTNQITVTNGAGTITLSLPQSINSTATPTFASMTLSATTNQLVLGTTNTTTINSTAPAASRVYTIPDTAANANFVMTELAQTINGNKTLSGTTNLSGLTASSILTLNASKNITSNVLTNGQLLIGSTGNVPAIASLTGTTNQITVTNGAGTITLSTPQSINSGATPTFASMTLTNTTNQIVLGTTNTVTISSTAPAASRTYTIPDTAANSNFVMTDLAQTINGNKTLSGTTNLSGLTASGTLYLDASKNIASTVLSNGQLFVGRTGNTPINTTLTGTTNQINITNASGSITLSTPQNIDTTANVTFGSVTTTNNTTVGGYVSITNDGLIKTRDTELGRSNLAAGLIRQKFSWNGTDAINTKANFDSIFTNNNTITTVDIITTLDPGNVTFGTNFGYQIVGYLNVTTSGNISFQTKSDDASDCFIDGVFAASNYGAHAFGGGTITTTTINLQAGYHRLVYRFLQGGSNWQYQLYWDTAGGSTFAAISSSNMFFNPNESFSYANSALTSYPLVYINNSTTSSDSTSGALVVTGGVGIGDNINCAGNITCNNITFGSLVTGVSTNGTASQLNFNVSSSTIALITPNNVQSTKPYLCANGTAGAPSYSFTNDTKSGMYLIGTSNLGVSCNSTKLLDISSTVIASTPNLKSPNLILTDVTASNFYATGTWTVTIGNGTTNFTTSITSGNYVRMGNVYHCWIQVVWTSKNSVTGSIQISLPATPSASVNPRVAPSIGFFSGITVANQLLATSNGGNSYIGLYDAALSGGSATLLSATSFSTAGEVQLNIFFSI